MTPRLRPVAQAIGALIILALVVAVPALVAYTLAARPVDTDQRIGQLEQRIEHLETDVSLLRE